LEDGELWISDSGSTYHPTGDPRLMYDMRGISPEERRIAIGDGRALNVIGMGSLGLILHAKTEFPITVKNVILVERMHFNLFSLHCGQDTQTMILDREG
ncbi:unnamed protein product, partial [Hapterophycus canaliculatus]